MGSEVIRVEGLVKTFGDKRIFDNYALSVSEGEMLAITGKSGSGKSTLLNILGLLEPFDTGSYHLFNQKSATPGSLRAQKIIRSKVNYVFQNFALIEHYTVAANLMAALHYASYSKQKKQHLAKEALGRVGLTHYESRKTFELSGGEQQRVALARCMIKPGELILADEPTGSLDKENREMVMGILHDLHQGGKTVIVVTHDEWVVSSCSRVVRL